MRAVTVVEPGKVEIVDIPAPVPGPYQALVKTEVACLCNSTDSKIFAGQFPGVEKYPAMLGHEGVGIVQEIGERVRNFKIGDRVIGGLVFEFTDSKYSSAWGGFCEYTLANDHDAMVAGGVADAEHGWLECYEIQQPVPSDILPDAAVLLCTWREVYGGCGDFQLQSGDAVLVFGAGPVGLSFVKLGKLLGWSYIGVVDPHQHKRDKAISFGADATFAPDSSELLQLTKTLGKPLDAAIDAVGRPEIINAALPLIKLGGTIGVYGVISDPKITIEKSKGPFNFNLIVHQWPTRSLERAALEPLCEWIRQGKLRADEFVTHEFPVEQIKDAIEEVRRGNVIKALLRY